MHLPTVQIGTAFYQQQAESRARTSPHVAAAMKGFEQLLLVLLRNANPLVTNHAHRIRSIALDQEMDGRSRL